MTKNLEILYSRPFDLQVPGDQRGVTLPPNPSHPLPLPTFPPKRKGGACPSFPLGRRGEGVVVVGAYVFTSVQCSGTLIQKQSILETVASDLHET